MKKVTTIILLAFSLMLLVSPAFAADATNPDAAKISFWSTVELACALGIGIAALGTGIGMGHGIRGACEGIARNPEASGKITFTMILGLALIESLAIYALVIIFILLYANPMKF